MENAIRSIVDSLFSADSEHVVITHLDSMCRDIILAERKNSEGEHGLQVFFFTPIHCHAINDKRVDVVKIHEFMYMAELVVNGGSLRSYLDCQPGVTSTWLVKKQQFLDWLNGSMKKSAINYVQRSLFQHASHQTSRSQLARVLSALSITGYET